MDLEEIWKQTKILHEVTKDNSSRGLEEVWNKLTSWLPNLSWLKGLFFFVFVITCVCVLACIMIQCCNCCNQSQRLWILLWRYSKPTWTRSCVACSRWPWFGRGPDDPEVPSKPWPSVIL